MNKNTCAFAILSFLSLAPAYAESTLPFDDLVAIARGSVAMETQALNAQLAGEEGTLPRRLIASMQNDGFRSVSAEYLMDRCIFASGDLLSLMDSELGSGDDRATAKSNAVVDLKRLYGKRIWRLLAEVCERAEERFERRLTEATVGGAPAGLSRDLVQTIKTFVFYPTLRGQPKVAADAFRVLSVGLTAAVFLGSSSTLIGIPVGRLILSMAVPANSLLALRAGLKKGERLFPEDDLRLDLNEIEWVQ